MSQPKLIIIHGWTYTIEPWAKVVELLQQRCVAVKQLRVPGLTEPSDRVWTIDDYVEWLAQELAGESSVTVLGHSNGGRIALHYLAKYPRQIRQLILLNSAGLYYQPTSLSRKRRLARRLAKIGKPLAKIPLLRKIFYRFLDSDYEKAPENMKQTLQNMLNSDKQFDPTTVVGEKIDILWGRVDKITPIGMGRELHEKLADSTFREFDDWQHAPYITHPEQVVEAIMEVL